MRKGILNEFAVAAILLSVPGVLKAQEHKATVDVNCGVGVTSNYTVAGFAQNRDLPSAIAYCDAEHKPTGLYVSGFTARGVDPMLYNGSSQEVDANFGVRKKIGPGMADFAYESFLYPGQNGPGDNNNTWRAAAKYSVKNFMVRYSVTTTELFGIPKSRGSSRIDVSYTKPVTEKLSLTAMGGHLAVKGPAASFSYVDVSANYKLPKGFSIEAGFADRDGRLTYPVGGGRNFNAARPRGRIGINYNFGFRR